jgi:hypothetical protein
MCVCCARFEVGGEESLCAFRSSCLLAVQTGRWRHTRCDICAGHVLWFDELLRLVFLYLYGWWFESSAWVGMFRLSVINRYLCS